MIQRANFYNNQKVISKRNNNNILSILKIIKNSNLRNKLQKKN